MHTISSSLSNSFFHCRLPSICLRQTFKHTHEHKHKHLQTENTHTLKRHWPSPLASISPVNIAKLSQTESVPARRIHVSIHGYHWAIRQNLKHLPNLHIHLKIRDWTPELWAYRINTIGHGFNWEILSFMHKDQRVCCTWMIRDWLRVWGWCVMLRP